MSKKNWVLSAALGSSMVFSWAMFGQPSRNIDAQKHPNLAAAQGAVVDAYQKVEDSQAYYKDRMGGHGEKAKELLAQADKEIKLAAEYANAHQ